MKRLRVIDFFCGAGGFSEGFRQQGFEIVMGVDNWRPAVASHNLNHQLEDEPGDILSFQEENGGTSNIDSLPNTEVIVGSPPCVSFSMANRAGKAEKGLGIRLIESFLRVVAVKKHQKGSVLTAWLMENVPPSRNHVQPYYTFADLNLTAWAKANGLKPMDVALKVRDCGEVLSAADFGSPQTRQRFVCGEWIATGEFPAPKKTHKPVAYVTLGDILSQLPRPTLRKSEDRPISDPNYPKLILPANEIPDHYYDSGVYSFEWRSARHAKVNHPFMGRMSFPEAMERPARTIMATRSASTREALMLKSERRRKGDGEYRLPTVREAATLMGFPLNYQFVGSEGTKWKQIGNAVCPHLSAALAKELRKRMGLKAKSPSFAALTKVLHRQPAPSLNDFGKRVFDRPPKRKLGAKYRSHPFKKGNMTIALMNHQPNGVVGGDWFAVAYLGAGKTYHTQLLNESNLNAAWKVLGVELNARAMKSLRSKLKKQVLSKVASGPRLQQIFELNDTSGIHNHPADLMDTLRECLADYAEDTVTVKDHGRAVVEKAEVPLVQVLAVVGVCEIAKKASPDQWKENSRLSSSKSAKVQGKLFGQP